MRRQHKAENTLEAEWCETTNEAALVLECRQRCEVKIFSFGLIMRKYRIEYSDKCVRATVRVRSSGALWRRAVVRRCLS